VDLLVKLYELDRYRERARVPEGVVVRNAMPYEASRVARWVAKRFGEKWSDEARACFSRQPVSCVLALSGNRLLGFACHDATLRGFFGPVGVDVAARGRGIGRALAWAAFDGLRARGYGYAIVGAASEVRFYVEGFGALPIPDSTPGPYVAALDEDA
jgi:ribosomal protein S18 acetylase RimI-like enzyme